MKKENLSLKCQMGMITPAQAVDSLGDATVKEIDFLTEFEKLALEKNPNISRFDKPESPRSQDQFRNIVCEMKNEVETNTAYETKGEAEEKQSPKAVEKSPSFLNSPVTKLLNKSPRGSPSPKSSLLLLSNNIFYRARKDTKEKRNVLRHSITSVI